jgi:polysaccharide biosynthesis/export protein
MKAPIKSLGILASTMFLLFSCTSQEKLMYLSNLDTTATEQFFPLERPDYHVQDQDILYINIYTLNSEMNTLINPSLQGAAASNFRDESNIYVFGYTVSDSGTSSMPILGDVYVYGKTLEEIKSDVEVLAHDYLIDAVVNIRLLSFKFTVIGEVNEPGTYRNFNNQLTVLDAIGMAGDITDFGNRTRLLVIRPTNEGTHTYRINVQDKNLLSSKGYFLLPNDIVVVEPIKSKPFQLNIPTMSLFLATISTLILIMTVVKN